MIQNLMRKHKRLFLGIVLVLIVPMFVLWGGSYGAGPSANAPMQEVVAVVGDRPISAETFRSYVMSELQQRSQFGQSPNVQQMLEDGTAMKVLESLVSSEIISEQAEKGKYAFDRDYLVEKIKDSPEFKDEQGQFNAKYWNDLVKRKDIPWNQFYDSERLQVARNLVIDRAIASARVLDDDLREQFIENNTTIELKYIAIAPKIEPTEEQIKETYDQNPEAYAIPEKRRAEFAAISLAPPKPTLVDELLQRARAGEDFAALATEHSESTTKETGGDLGWLSDTPLLRPHQRLAISLQKGEVSEPVDGPNGYYIYKVEDERTDPVSNRREVKVREIMVKAVLGEAEYTEAKKKADAIYAKAKETGDLSAAAAEAGVEVKTSGPFALDSLSIENVPDVDARFLRSRLAGVAVNEVTEPFEAQQNIYVAKVAEVIPSEPQPLEAVREDVLKDTIARIENSQEYRQQVAELSQKIATSAKSLQDIATQYPELNATIQTMPAFSAKTYDFASGPMWNPRDILALAGDKEPGAFIGPINDFMGKVYFAELVSKTPPDEKMMAEQWPEELKTLREQALQQEEQRRIQDYLAYQRENLLNKGEYNVDNGAFLRALGLLQDSPEEGEQPAGEAPPQATGAPALGEEPPAIDPLTPIQNEGLPTVDGSAMTPSAIEAPATAEPAPAEPATEAPAVEAAPAEAAPAEGAAE